MITGASAGIGAALAKVLGARGDALVLAARREKELREVARASSADALAVVADVTRRADVERIRDEAVARFGHVDVSINNAGRGIQRKVLELGEDDVDAMMRDNVKSALWGMQVAAAHFMSRGAGHLVNVSSFLGRVPLAPMRSVYSASKAALGSLTSSLRADLAATHPGITVSLVMPGMVTTAFASNALHATTATPSFTPPPSMRPQSAEEVAEILAAHLDAPRPELYTNPAHAEMAARHLADPTVFHGLLAPPKPAS